jgi:hypothetical protein
MKNRQGLRPQLELLEPLMLLSSGPGLLGGTGDGTFFAHVGSAKSGTVYSLFGSGKIAPVGSTLIFGGFQTSGFTAHGAGGGNLLFNTRSRPGNVELRLTELSGTAVRSAGQFEFRYRIVLGAGASSGAPGSGTLVVTLQPINTNIQGKPVSNPGFFGNAKFTFA